MEYKAKGICLGRCWGGGVCGYATREYKADNMQDLENAINEGIKTGSIDSGMGFESVLGAVMQITETRRRFNDFWR